MIRPVLDLAPRNGAREPPNSSLVETPPDASMRPVGGKTFILTSESSDGARVGGSGSQPKDAPGLCAEAWQACGYWVMSDIDWA